MAGLFKTTTTTTTLLLRLLLCAALVDSFDLDTFFPDIFRHNDNAQPREPELGNTCPCAAASARSHSTPTASGGRWEMFKDNAGVSAMHLVINHDNKAVFFDSTIYNPSQLRLPATCRKIPGALNSEEDCWAHAAEMDIHTGEIQPLKILMDTWCSSGAFRPDGTLVQTGEWKDGGRAVRYLETCENCDFQEFPIALSGGRWYATQQILPDGSFVVIGGCQMFNYEYIPPPGKDNPTNINLPFLAEASNKLENNLYPFVHLTPDGNIFLFANNCAILFDPKNAQVIRKSPCSREAHATILPPECQSSSPSTSTSLESQASTALSPPRSWSAAALCQTPQSLPPRASSQRP